MNKTIENKWEKELLKILNDKEQSIVLDLRLKDFVAQVAEEARREERKILESVIDERIRFIKRNPWYEIAVKELRMISFYIKALKE